MEAEALGGGGGGGFCFENPRSVCGQFGGGVNNFFGAEIPSKTIKPLLIAPVPVPVLIVGVRADL